jgi:F0F1-type ATP synthase assembly protein I
MMCKIGDVAIVRQLDVRLQSARCAGDGSGTQPTAAHGLELTLHAADFRLRIISQADKFRGWMANTEGNPPERSARETKDIADKRDALLAQARSGKGLGFTEKGADPRLMGLGVQFVVAILLCLYAGMWLDAKLHTGPWLMLLGAIVGASAGFYSMYSVLMSENKKFDEQDRQHKIDEQAKRK